MQFYLATMQSSNGYPWQRFEKAFIRSLASVQVSWLNLYSQLITHRLLTTKTVLSSKLQRGIKKMVVIWKETLPQSGIEPRMISPGVVRVR